MQTTKEEVASLIRAMALLDASTNALPSSYLGHRVAEALGDLETMMALGISVTLSGIGLIPEGATGADLDYFESLLPLLDEKGAPSEADTPAAREWERVTRAAWEVHIDAGWSLPEREAIEDFILTVRHSVGE